VPGRAEHVRGPSESELKATAVLALPIEESSAKIRTGPPIDDDEDHALPYWAGTLPVRMQVGTPEPDPRLTPGIEVPPHAASYRRPGWR
jgi:uncharacterized protein